MVLVQLEDYGFCAKGEGGPFAASGALRLGGALPTNTAGGQLSEGHCEGMLQIVEAVHQVRRDRPPTARSPTATSRWRAATAATRSATPRCVLRRTP